VQTIIFNILKSIYSKQLFSQSIILTYFCASFHWRT